MSWKLASSQANFLQICYVRCRRGFRGRAPHFKYYHKFALPNQPLAASMSPVARSSGELLLVFPALNEDPGTAVRIGLDLERNLENLLEQVALVDRRGRADAQAFAAMQQYDLIREFRSEIEIVSDFDDGITMLVSQMPKAAQQVDLRANIKMERGFIEQQNERLLRERASKDNALLFAAGDFMHPAIA